jgi:MFS family permease
LHGVNCAGDVLVAVGLAGTLFFAVPVGEARERVALYLLLTMAPFTVLSPLLGPALDRVRRGRRWALAGTFALRMVLVAVLADAVAAPGPGQAVRLYPTAFGALVASKAYTVLRAAAVPRMRPPGLTLVGANSRVGLAGVAGAASAAALGAALGTAAGPVWVLRLACAVFLGGAVLAPRLPRAVESAEGERPARLRAEPEPDARPRRWNVGPRVVLGLRVNVAVRALSGFLLFYLAFLLRTLPLGGLSPTTGLGLVIAAVAVGGLAGTALGATVGSRSPETACLGVLGMAALGCVLASWRYGTTAVLTAAAVAGFAQAVGKLGLDALVQREVPESVRASAFARSETVLQLAWVLGGGLGIVLPGPGALGLAVAAGGLTVGLVVAALPALRATADGAAADRRVRR